MFLKRLLALFILMILSSTANAGLSLVESLDKQASLQEVVSTIPLGDELNEELESIVQAPAVDCFRYSATGSDDILDLDCGSFLNRMQTGIVSGLSEKIQTLKEEVECLENTSAEFCDLVIDQDSLQLEKFQSYRHNLYQFGISYNGSDFESVAQVNGGELAVLRRRVSPMSEGEQTNVWSSFDTYQRNYVKSWWESPQVSRRFPNADKCIDGGIENLQPFRGKMLRPTFRSQFTREDRQHRIECDNLFRFYHEADYAVPMLYTYHDDLQEDIESDLENVEPWFHLLTRDTSEMNQQEKFAVTKKAKEDLISDYEKILSWVENLEDDQKEKLLGFDHLALEMGAPQICDGYSKFGWNDVYSFIPELITPINVFKNIFVDSPLNDRAFLAGFMQQEEYEAARADIAREQAGLLLLSTPLAAVQGGLIKGVGTGTSFLARKFAPDGVRSLNRARSGAIDFLGRFGIQRRLNVRPATSPRVNAIEEYMAKTGRNVEIRQTREFGQVIFDNDTGEAIFAYKYKVNLRGDNPYFKDITVEAAGHSAANKGHGFFSMFFNRMVRQNPGVNRVQADLWYDNLARVNELVRQGYSPLEAIKDSPSYRVYLQNGFSEIDASSLRITNKSDGTIGRITFFVDRP